MNNNSHISGTSNDVGVKKDTTAFAAHENPCNHPVSSPIGVEGMAAFELTVENVVRAAT